MRVERGAQFVRTVGEQQFVRLHQLFDAADRVIEALSERGHFVLALDRHARRQVALAQPFDAGLEALQPAGEAPGHRIGADGDR